MNTKRALLAALIAGGLALTAGAADAAQLAGLFHKAPRASAEYATSAKRFKPVNSGCGAAIARVEAQTGGKVISANLVGGNRCRLVVLIPSNNRSRPPKTQTVVVPAG